jgi:tripartite-type tricarboxylate transporter receptor subunit TctC
MNTKSNHGGNMRGIGFIGLLSTLTLGAPLAVADTYPARPIRLIVPFAPGGSTDTIARVVGQKLSDAWGQQIVIDNRAGAASNIGTALAAKALPDGYTLVMGTTGLAANPSLYPKVGFDPLRDFSPVVNVAVAPLIVVVYPGLAAKTLPELVTLAKAQPGRLNYASAGSATHLATELLKSRVGIEMTHVPYKGSAPATTDLIAGQVQVMVNNMLSALPQVKSGRLRALAVTTRARTSFAPEVPTVAESGYPGFEASSWFNLLAPAKTQVSIVTKLNQEVNRVLREADVRAQFTTLGVDPLGGTVAESDAFLRAEVDKWSKLIREKNLQQK